MPGPENNLSTQILPCISSGRDFSKNSTALLDRLLLDCTEASITQFLTSIFDILNSPDYPIESKFYALFLLVSATQTKNMTLLTQLTKSILLTKLQLDVQFDNAAPLNDKFKKIAALGKPKDENIVTTNYITLILEAISYWNTAYGKPDKQDPLYMFYFIFMNLSSKVKMPSSYFYIGKKHKIDNNFHLVPAIAKELPAPKNEEIKEEIIVKSTLNEIKRLFVKEFLIVWHDPTLNDTAMYDELQSIADIKAFVDWKAASTYLAGTDLACHIITSGTNGELLVNAISSFPHVHSIHVFCNNVTFHKQWAKNYKKIIGVENQFPKLFDSIKKQINTWERQNSSWRVNLPAFAPIFNDQDKSGMNNLYLYLRGLVNFTNREQGKKDFTSLARAIAHDLNNISEFEKKYINYDMKSILNWYTKECFLYKVTNNCLRIATSDSIQYCRLVLKDLEAAIKEQYQKKSQEFSGLLYRGAYISADEWTKLQQNVGKQIEMYGFLSTSKAKAVALMFAQADPAKKALLTIIVPAAPEKARDEQGFAEVKEFSDFQAEEEVLFNVRSRFTVLEAVTEQIDGKQCRHLVLLYCAQSLRKYVRENSPVVELQMNKTAEIKCSACKTKIPNEPDSILYAVLSQKNVFCCQGCLQNYQKKEHSPLLCIPSVLRNDKDLDLKLKGIIFKYPKPLGAPFYGYTCHFCLQTRLESYGKCLDCQDTKKTWCTQCLSPDNECIKQGHLIAVETLPFTFWSDEMTLNELNHLEYFNQFASNFTSNNIFQPAAIFDEANNHTKAKEYLENFLKQNEGKPSAETADAYDLLGATYYQMGQYSKARDALYEAMDIRTLLGLGLDSKMAITYLFLGKLNTQLDEYNKALEFFDKALKISVFFNGEKHPTTSSIYNQIGIVYNDLKKYEQALEYHQKDYEICKSIYGDSHLLTTRCLGSLANVYDHMKNFDKALEYNLTAINHTIMIHGEIHPDTAKLYNNIGLIYISLGQPDKAREYITKGLEIRRSVFKNDHPEIAASCHNLGLLYRSLKQYEKSLEYLSKALYIKKSIYGENHLETAFSYEHLGRTFGLLGQFEKAVDCITKHMEVLEVLSKEPGAEQLIPLKESAQKTYFEFHFLTAAAYFNGYFGPKNISEGVKWIKKAADEGDSKCQSELGSMYLYGDFVEKDPEQAVYWYKKAAEQNHRESQRTLGLINCLYSNRDPEQGIYWLTKAAEQEDVRAQHRLGEMHLTGHVVKQDFEKAADWLEKAATQNEGLAQYLIGCLYERGKGVETNKERAFNWLSKVTVNHEESKENMQLQACPHKLLFKQCIDDEKFKCGFCCKISENASGWWECAPCNLKICRKCKPIIHSTEQCPNQHPLKEHELLKMGAAQFVCSLCLAEREYFQYRCEECDFDVCMCCSVEIQANK